MKELSEIAQKLDKKIDKTIVELKLDGVANLIYDLNARKSIQDFTLGIYTNDKRIRRDCFYDAQDTFDTAFTVNLQQGNEEVSFKEHFKDLILFAMKYRAKDFYIEFYIQEEKYDANDILNQFINRNFFKENKKYTEAELFERVVSKIADKGANVAQYVYKEPAQHNQSQLHSEDETRRLQEQLLASLGQASTRRSKI